MAWLQNSWMWFVGVADFIAKHFFGHGGHSHGNPRHDGGNREPDSVARVTSRLRMGPQTHTLKTHGVAMSERLGRIAFQAENAVVTLIRFKVA